MSSSRFGSLLERAARLGAQAIYLRQGQTAYLRIQDAVLVIPDDSPWSAGELEEVLRSLVQKGPRQIFAERGHVQFSYRDKRGVLWLGAATRSEGEASLTFMTYEPPERVELPAPFLEAVTQGGWSWVCGASGSGRTAALERSLGEIAQKRTAHVLVVERGVARIQPPRGGRPLLFERSVYQRREELAPRLRDADPDVLIVDDLDGGPALMACAEIAARGRIVISSHRGGTFERALGHALLRISSDERLRFRELLARHFRAGLLQVLVRGNTARQVSCHELHLGGDALSRYLRAQPFAITGPLPGRAMELKDGLLGLVKRAQVHPACALRASPWPGPMRRALAASGFDIDANPPLPPTEIPPELRREARVRVPNGIANISILDEHGRCARLIQGRVLDLSSSGLGVELPRPLRHAVEVQVAFTLGEEQLEARGVVRSARRRSGGSSRWLAGVALTLVSPEVRARIDEFVRLEE